jgi:SAM-dependent methyltransferase
VFDEDKPDWQAQREQLRELLAQRDRHADPPSPSVEAAYNAARRTTLNAHYTHPQLARAMWDLAARLGFAGGNVLEPGCGLGTFIGLAPTGTAMTGVEVDQTTAAIAQALYPEQRIVARSFADPTRARDGSFDMAIGNVPFAEVTLHDPRHNPAAHSIHNHFIIKSLALTKPGGLVVLLTSRYTLDARNPSARHDMSELGDLLAAVRLPSGAHRRIAGTEALTDPAGVPPPSVWQRAGDLDELAAHPGDRRCGRKRTGQRALHRAPRPRPRGADRRARHVRRADARGERHGRRRSDRPAPRSDHDRPGRRRSRAHADQRNGAAAGGG